MKMRDKVMRILKNLSQLDEIDKDSTLQGTLGFSWSLRTRSESSLTSRI